MTRPFVFVCLLGLLVGIGCGKNAVLDAPDSLNETALTTTQPPLPLAKSAFLDTLRHGAIVKATVTQNGLPVQDVELAFARSIAGTAPDYRWQRQTNANGFAEVEITTAPVSQLWPVLPPAIDLSQLPRNGATGYYQAKATDPVSGQIVGAWHSIFINGGTETVLSLPTGERFQVVRQEAMLAFEDQTYVVQTIDDMSVEEFGRIRDSVIFPLEIRLRNFNPIAAFRGGVNFVRFGWLETAFKGKDHFTVITRDLLGPEIPSIHFYWVTITAQSITGWFVPVSPTIDFLPFFFIAQTSGISISQIGGTQ